MIEAHRLLEEFARARGVALSADQMKLIDAYVKLVLEQNAKVNLTADADERALLLRHAADGIAAVPVLKKHVSAANPRVCDVGSGGGFIGVSIKLAWPEAEVTLVEALERKFKFLNLAAARTGLKGLRVLKKKAGQDAFPAEFDAVTARALTALPDALKICLPLLKPGGIFVDYESDPARADEKSLADAGARLIESHPYRLPDEDKDRYLAVFSRA